MLSWFGLVYWGLAPQQQPGSYQGGEMMMMKSVFWWRKPEYPEETTDFKAESQISWKISIHFNVIHRKVPCRNPKLKSLNSMPAFIKLKVLQYTVDIDVPSPSAPLMG